MNINNCDHDVELSIAETAHRSAQIRNASRMLHEAYDARNKAALVAASDTCFRLARSNIVLSERHANLKKRMSEEACRTQRMQEVLNGYVSDDLRELAGKNEEAAEMSREEGHFLDTGELKDLYTLIHELDDTIRELQDKQRDLTETHKSARLGRNTVNADLVAVNAELAKGATELRSSIEAAQITLNEILQEGKEIDARVNTQYDTNLSHAEDLKTVESETERLKATLWSLAGNP